MEQIIIGGFFIIFTIIVYLLMNKLYLKYSFPLFTPILTAAAVIVGFLLIFHVSYPTYMIGGAWINKLLGPAVVALAFPLYKQRKTLLKYRSIILSGVIGGVLFGIFSGLLMAEILGINQNVIASILPKSLTTPVAIQISTNLGGIPAMTAIFVMVAGLSGAIIGPMVLQLFQIQNPISKGIALGSASHAVGTSKALEYGELPFSMSSVSMTLSAILGSIISPIIAMMFHI